MRSFLETRLLFTCSWEGSTLAYNQDGPRQILVDWVNATGKSATAFDFPTKGILQVHYTRDITRIP